MIGSRYRLEEVVGAGAMAIVWRAHDELLDRPVAIKVMSNTLSATPAHVARFAREAQTAAGITHSNLVQVFDYSAAAETPYLVMEYIDGGTLGARIDRGPLSGGEARRLACDLLAAIACVHGAGVLHRDVKPANVLLSTDGRARLTDFGIAGLEDATRITQPGHLMGTIRYLAPELIEGARPSRKSDLYALGVLLRESTAGGEPDSVMEEVVELLTRPDPALRAGDAGDLLRRLRADAPDGPGAPAAPRWIQAATAAPSPDPPPHRAVRASRPRRTRPSRHAASRRIRAAAAGAVAAAATAIAAILLGASGGAPTRAATASPAAVPVVQHTLSVQARLSLLQRSVRAAATR